MANETGTISLKEIPGDFPAAEKSLREMPEEAKAQFKMTYWVLAGVFLLLVVSGLVYVLTGDGLADFSVSIAKLCAVVDSSSDSALIVFCNEYGNRNWNATINPAAKDFFEFVKSFVPPIVTLVLGAHYVTKGSDTN